MKIAILGSGGVGGYFGGRLAAAGSDVTFIARGAHLDAIRRNGLRLISPRGDAHIARPKVVETIAEAGPVDLVLQNGVRKDDILRAPVPAGEIATDMSPDSAGFLVCVVQGLNVLAKTKPSRERLERVAATALSTLENTP